MERSAVGPLVSVDAVTIHTEGLRLGGSLKAEMYKIGDDECVRKETKITTKPLKNPHLEMQNNITVRPPAHRLPKHDIKTTALGRRLPLTITTIILADSTPTRRSQAKLSAPLQREKMA